MSKYRITKVKYFSSYIDESHAHFEIDYSRVFTEFYLEKKNKWWFGWSYIFSSEKLSEVEKILENLKSVECSKEEIIYIDK